MKVMLDNEKINEVEVDVGSIISKDGGCSEDVKSRIEKALGLLSRLKKFGGIG